MQTGYVKLRSMLSLSLCTRGKCFFWKQKSSGTYLSHDERDVLQHTPPREETIPFLQKKRWKKSMLLDQNDCYTLY